MTARTHDLAAFTLLTAIIAYLPALPPMSLATATVAFGANFIGALFPDLDKPTASFWKKFRAGPLIGRLLKPLIGSHRLISHSLLGLVLAGWLVRLGLSQIDHILIVDMDIVWWAFILGATSHLLADSLTKEGIPLFFPLPWHFGLPPLRSLRITTGGKLEKYFIFPLLILISIYCVFHARTTILTSLTQMLS